MSAATHLLARAQQGTSECASQKKRLAAKKGPQVDEGTEGLVTIVSYAFCVLGLDTHASRHRLACRNADS